MRNPRLEDVMEVMANAANNDGTPYLFTYFIDSHFVLRLDKKSIIARIQDLEVLDSNDRKAIFDWMKGSKSGEVLLIPEIEGVLVHLGPAKELVQTVTLKSINL